jgi:hypothetical protein
MDIFYGLLLSAHLGLEKDYNWFHPHVGAYLDDQYKWTAGAYYNSESEISTYVAYTFDISDTKYIDVGLVTGYSDADVKPMVKFNYNQFFVLPTIETIKDTNGNRQNFGAVMGIEWRY